MDGEDKYHKSRSLVPGKRVYLAGTHLLHAFNHSHCWCLIGSASRMGNQCSAIVEAPGTQAIAMECMPALQGGSGVGFCQKVHHKLTRDGAARVIAEVQACLPLYCCMLPAGDRDHTWEGEHLEAPSLG